MDKIVWIIIMALLGSFFTVLGIYACRRKKPMWFWSGSTVSEEEISDIRAYNRANGIMWFAYSLVFWLCAVIGFFNPGVAGPVLGVGCVGGIPLLVLVYTRIYKKYKK